MVPDLTIKHHFVYSLTLILISEKFDIPVDEMLKSGDVVEKIDNNKTSFKKDSNYSRQLVYRQY